MDITKLNFDETFEELAQVIEEANFFSIDGEFSGLATADISSFDKLSEFYGKMAEDSNDFIMIQLGFTAFKLNENANPPAFTYRSYNFYIYPQAQRQRFSCQGESLRFLAQHNFDFNKLFQDGISYCNLPEEVELIARFNERKKWFDENVKENTDNHTEVPEDEKDKLKRIKLSIEEFLISDEDERVISNCNGFQRRLVYELIETEFRDKILATSKDLQNNRKAIVIERKKNNDDDRRKLREKLKEEEDLLKQRIGFRRFIDLLSKSKKLIIGHNMLLDVMYMMRQFFGPLPSSLKDFKSMTHKAFPNLLDTKHLCQSEIIKSKISSTTLPILFNTLSNMPFELPPIEPESNEYSYSSDSPREHEAGYDSYITGLCFISMAKFMQVDLDKMNEKSVELRSFINKLSVFRLIHVSFMDLTGNEPEPNREHIFHVTIPIDWERSNVTHHFRNYGPVYVAWTGPKAAYISLNHRENASILLKSIDRPNGFTIQSYDDYQRSKEDAKITLNEKRKTPEMVPETNEPITKKPKKDQQPKSTTNVKKTFAESDDW